MGEAGKGVLAMVGACTIWGLSGFYFRALDAVPPPEILSHRVLWSVAFFAGVLAWQGRFGDLAAAARTPRTLATLVATALLVGTNWFVFLFAIHSDRALEASLGYYVFPLVAVALGFLVRGERFGAMQGAAIGLAALAVGLLTVGLGAAPWIALTLGVTFGGYGLLKGGLGLGPVVSVALETLLVAPFAALWLLWLHGGGNGAFGRDLGTGALLVLSGPLMTGLPLMLFSYAARRVRLATVGLVQYLNPTLQFIVAVAVFGEVFTIWHGVAFPMIWLALVLYSIGAWRQERHARRSAISAGTVG
jgi:chloramphenicol-sensitive protein RarD